MNNAAVVYREQPAFEDQDSLEVVIAWNDARGQFLLDIKKGLAPNKRRWLGESPELEALLREAAGLRLPLGVDGSAGFDGISYSLQVGSSPSARFSWWRELPQDWAPLRPILSRIQELVNKEHSARDSRPEG